MARTFSKLAGLTREKQMRNTSCNMSHVSVSWLPGQTHSLWVGERPQPVVVLLAGRVPQSQVDGSPVHLKRLVLNVSKIVSSTLTITLAE